MALHSLQPHFHPLQLLNSIVISCVRVGYFPRTLVDYAETRGMRLIQPTVVTDEPQKAPMSAADVKNSLPPRPKVRSYGSWRAAYRRSKRNCRGSGARLQPLHGMGALNAVATQAAVAGPQPPPGAPAGSTPAPQPLVSVSGVVAAASGLPAAGLPLNNGPAAAAAAAPALQQQGELEAGVGRGGAAGRVPPPMLQVGLG